MCKIWIVDFLNICHKISKNIIIHRKVGFFYGISVSIILQASRQSLPDQVKTERTVLKVLGFADRSALPKKFLDFCGSFPISKVEEASLDSMNTTMVREQGK